jgi:glutaredoxin
VTLVIYGKPGCCLCEKAEQVAARLRREFSFEIRLADITRDPVLRTRYREAIPVVALDGVEIARGQVTIAGLRAALDRASRLAGE